MTSRELRESVQRQMRGYRIVAEKDLKSLQDNLTTQPDAVAPSLDALQKKLKRTLSSPSGSAGATLSGARHRTGKVYSFVVEPDTAAARERSPGRKTVLVSEEGKIVGFQG